MLKAKVINENNCPGLELKINQWLKGKEKIRIISTNQTEGPGQNSDIESPSITVTVFYEDDELNLENYFEKE